MTERRRVVAIRIPLTDEQKALIRRVSGTEVQEAVFAAEVSHDQPLENELTSEADNALAEAVLRSNQDFVGHARNAPDIKRAFEKHIGHELDPGMPAVVLLR